jgi:hypothetical protein
VKSSKIYERIIIHYGSSCTSQGNIYEWAKRFKGMEKFTVDDGHSGLLSTTRYIEDKE